MKRFDCLIKRKSGGYLCRDQDCMCEKDLTALVRWELDRQAETQRSSRWTSLSPACKVAALAWQGEQIERKIRV